MQNRGSCIEKRNEKNNIVIGQPYIEDCGAKVKLCAAISVDGITRTLYYEVSEEYRGYLCNERLDSFLLGLINEAMYTGRDIVCQGYVTEALLFQLENYYIPIISNNMHDMDAIKVTAQTISEPIKSVGAVVTGNSGGVDSLYSVLKHIEGPYPNLKLTHLIFNNISTADTNEDRIRALFNRDEKEKEDIALELGLKHIGLYTNLYDFYSSKYIFNFYFTAQYASVAYALCKLLKVYYFSSGFSIGEFTLDERKIKDGAYFDLFTLDVLSTELVRFYSSGGEVDRLEKTEFISHNTCSHKHLQVCAVEQFAEYYEHSNIYTRKKLNCGKCRKCLRTISSLYALQKIEHFEYVFDMTYFEKNKNSFLAHELVSDSHSFSYPIRNQLKQSGLFSVKIYFWMFVWKMIEINRNFFRKFDWARKIYYSYRSKKNQKQ